MSIYINEDGVLTQERDDGQKGRGLSPKTIAVIEAARKVCEEIEPATVRAACYRLFIMGLIESMAKGETQRVSKALVFARENELIPWEWIVDETRQLERASAWQDLKSYGAAVIRSYRKDFWVHQPVWSEKGTVRGTLQPVLDEFAIGFRVMHGFGSATTVHDVADGTIDLKKPLRALYAGDFDASGMYMSEVDLPRRLERYGGRVDLQRIALTSRDIADPNLPSFALETKRGDPRHDWFLRNYGGRCWELDAMSPPVLRGRVRMAIMNLIDQEAWDHCKRIEAAELESVRNFKWG